MPAAMALRVKGTERARAALMSTTMTWYEIWASLFTMTSSGFISLFGNGGKSETIYARQV